jgi:hypothetical protein
MAEDSISQPSRRVPGWLQGEKGGKIKPIPDRVRIVKRITKWLQTVWIPSFGRPTKWGNPYEVGVFDSVPTWFRTLADGQ